MDIRHVVQGGPISNHLNRGVNLRKPFQDADLNSVSFQEYHPDFPHKKYTLGYGTWEVIIANFFPSFCDFHDHNSFQLLSFFNFFVENLLAGRPGGPDFYVSTVDNTVNHGPGGQSSYAIASEADPCFAKVVEGFGAVDRMHKMNVNNPGGYKRMTHYVAIKSAKILSSSEL